MTGQEKAEIKAEILEELEEKLKGVAIREDTQGVLSEVRNKWFRSTENRVKGVQHSDMFKVFGPVTYWMVWELIRKLTCMICGVGYVRQISDKEKANYAAEILCKAVYDLRKEFMEKDNINQI